MNAAGSRSGLRLGVQVSALVAAGSLGFLAAQPPGAAADGLLPTTVAIPALPVTLPVTVPTVSVPTVTAPTVPVPTTSVPTVTVPNPTSTGTTTTPGTTVTTTTTKTTTVTTSSTTSGGTAATAGPTSAASTSGAGEQATPAAFGASVAERAVAGAVRLAGGSISIPVKSVAAPNGLVLAVAVTPRTVDATRLLKTSVRVRDRRGYLVRGATVTIRSIPNGLLDRTASKRSAADGRATFVVRAKEKGLRAGSRLWLLVTATDPARLKTVSVSRAVAIRIAGRSR
jgi:hypothetical protein